MKSELEDQQQKYQHLQEEFKQQSSKSNQEILSKLDQQQKEYSQKEQRMQKQAAKLEQEKQGIKLELQLQKEKQEKSEAQYNLHLSKLNVILAQQEGQIERQKELIEQLSGSDAVILENTASDEDDEDFEDCIEA